MKSLVLSGIASWLLAGYMALAQPGICACWLLKDVQHVHPHLDAHPERPHSHDYLFQISSAQTITTAPPTPEPALRLIDLLSLTGLWRPFSSYAPLQVAWSPVMETPPPRAFLLRQKSLS
jgi:hypothetical protein